jgi:hypothetical protein
MGHDLGRVVLRHCRGFLVGGALAAAIVLACGATAAADEPTPGAGPGQASTPAVSPPSQQQIDDAKAALDRLRNQGKTEPTGLSQVAGPTTPRDDRDEGGVTSRISDQAWWTIGAGALVLLVASETTRLSVRRAKHRKGT